MKPDNVNKAEDTVKNVFAIAEMMDRAGRFKATVYADNKEVYILNLDGTVLLRYRPQASRAVFKHPVSFRAGDYESETFYEKDGQIVFVTEAPGQYIKTKSCAAPERDIEGVRQIFNAYPKPSQNMIVLSPALPSLLDEGLSHVEFSASDGAAKIVQRDIFSGAQITLVRAEAEGFADELDSINSDFGPIGIRTSDLLALFQFQTQEGGLVLSFDSDKPGFAYLNATQDQENVSRYRLSGVIACCLYDELGEIGWALNPDFNIRTVSEEQLVEGSDTPPVPEKPARRACDPKPKAETPKAEAPKARPSSPTPPKTEVPKAPTPARPTPPKPGAPAKPAPKLPPKPGGRS